MVYRVVIFIVSVFLLLGCSGGKHDARLEHVAGIVSDSPREALSCLDSIDYRSLSTRDRHYHDFLSLKARDKAYIVHESDSLILDLLKYYSSNRGMYPEVLYYGGRVYSDLGDYPTALRYFQNSLDLLPENTNRQQLRATALSQTGRLLNTLRLYDKAIPYIKESIRTDSILKNSLNRMFDIQLLGAIYLHDRKYNIADNCFKEARKIAAEASPADTSLMDMYLAAIKLKTGDMDSARIMIRPVIDKVNVLDRDNALAYGAEIYFKAGVPDTALIYARELIWKENSYNRGLGLQIALSPQLKEYIPSDSLYHYAGEYIRLSQNTLDRSMVQDALIQDSYYNYQLHERERANAEKEKQSIKNVLLLVLFILLILVAAVLYFKNKNKHNLLQLHEALDNLSLLRKWLTSDVVATDRMADNLGIKSGTTEDPVSGSSDNEKNNSRNVQDLRKRFRDELLELQRNSNSPAETSSDILSSEVYASIQNYISNDKIISDENPLWDEIEQTVIKSSPNFKYRLQLLTGGNLKPADYHLALLIKCGVTPTQMSRLIGRAKATISYRRDALCVKIFGERLGVKAIDDIIRLL